MLASGLLYASIPLVLIVLTSIGALFRTAPASITMPLWGFGIYVVIVIASIVAMVSNTDSVTSDLRGLLLFQVAGAMLPGAWVATRYRAWKSAQMLAIMKAASEDDRP
jgi:hypothetical protein